MPLYDKPLEELIVYKPEPTSEPDLDLFWERTLEEAQQIPLEPRLKQLDYPAQGVTVYECYYQGWQGAEICGWYLVPENTEPPLPTLIQYHGYSGYKQGVHHYLMWALQGYAVLALDVRGQSGNSTDPGPYSGGHVTGWMTKGVLEPDDYYYRGAFVDCVRALDFVSGRPEVDAERIGIMGMSQGGGLTLAVAALDPRPIVAMPEMPYLCHYKRAVDVAMRGPYLEIAEYLRKWPRREEQVWRTLSYFDNMNLAERIRCPVLMTVGLCDDICPPSTVYAAYNRIEVQKELMVYPYHNHEMVDAHWETKLAWAQRYLMRD